MENRPSFRESELHEYKESMRTLTFEKLKERVRNLDEMIALIEQREQEADDLVGQDLDMHLLPTAIMMSEQEMTEREREAAELLADSPELARVETEEETEPELRTEEVAIIDRLQTSHNSYDFYMARRQQEGQVFSPETAVLARARGKIYLAVYEGEDTDAYEAINEERFLKETINPKTATGKFDKSLTTADRLAVLSVDQNQKPIGEGGEGAITSILFRPHEKLFPEAGVRKEPLPHLEEGENLDIVNALGGFINKSPDAPGAKHLIRPLGTVEINDQQNMLYEMAESEEGVARDLLELLYAEEEAFSTEQRMTALLQMFKALKFMSDRGIRHNDIKPANMLASKDGLKICDYGLMTFNKKDVAPEHQRQASELPDELNVDRYRGDGEYCLQGTVFFMHPEIAVGSQRFKHDNSDMFAAAITASTILARQHPASWLPPHGAGDNYMRYMYEHREFRNNLARSLHEAIQEDRFNSYDASQLRELRGLILDSLDPGDNGAFTDPNKFVELLKKMGVDENLSLVPEKPANDEEEPPADEPSPKDVPPPPVPDTDSEIIPSIDDFIDKEDDETLLG